MLFEVDQFRRRFIVVVHVYIVIVRRVDVREIAEIRAEVWNGAKPDLDKNEQFATPSSSVVLLSRHGMDRFFSSPAASCPVSSRGGS